MKYKISTFSPLSFLTLAFIFLGACSSTMLVEKWSDENYQGPRLKKILVIGLMKKDSSRRSFENEFVRIFSNDIRTGIASHELLPDLEKHANKESVLAAVEKSGADGVLIITSRGLAKQDRITPATVDYIPNMGMGYGMYGYYGSSHSYAFNPGNTVTDTILRVDTKLFNVATKKMIWSGKTESLNPKSATKLIAEFEQKVIRDMRKNGFVD